MLRSPDRGTNTVVCNVCVCVCVCVCVLCWGRGRAVN